MVQANALPSREDHAESMSAYLRHMHSPTTALEPHGRKVVCGSSCGPNDSLGFDPKPIVNGDFQPLFAANIAFRSLHWTLFGTLFGDGRKLPKWMLTL